MITIDDSNYELWLLRYAEQELTAEERKAVEAWLEEHPEAAEELDLYNEAPRLERDESVRYGAALLHHTQPLWPVLLRWSAAAAVVAALMVPALSGITEMEKTAPIVREVAAVQQTEEVQSVTDTVVPTILIKPAIAQPQEVPLVAEAIEQEEEPVVEVPEELPTAPEVIYTEELIVYEPAPDTVYTNSLIIYDDSRRSWT